MNKYTYLFVLQGRYEQGWEDITASVSRKEIKSDFKSYRENEGGIYRVIRRRELNKEDQK